ncbi:MAG: IS3 family transposase, partial [Candidatus Meridianibacter frigidus]
MSKRREYSSEYKRNAVQLVLSGKKSRSVIARELGIRADLLYHWQKALAPTSPGVQEGGNLNAEQRRIRELERENATLKEEREILKKAAADSMGQG